MDDEFESDSDEDISSSMNDNPDSTEDIIDHVQGSVEFMQDIIGDFLNSKGLLTENQDSEQKSIGNINHDKFFKSLREILNQYEARPTPIIKGPG